MIKKIAHIGIAVKDLEKQAKFYHETLGFSFEGYEDLPKRGLKIGLFAIGGVRIELLQPTGTDSAIAKFLEEKGEGVHHLAFEVRDIKGELGRLKAAGVELIDSEPRPGVGEAMIAFLNPKSTGRVLIELCEAKNH
jgi:methylmalonyl-CoA/ethylmalonyl-CoA epimerase